MYKTKKPPVELIEEVKHPVSIEDALLWDTERVKLEFENVVSCMETEKLINYLGDAAPEYTYKDHLIIKLVLLLKAG